MSQKSQKSILRDIDEQANIIQASIDTMIKESANSDGDVTRGSYFRAVFTILSVVLSELNHIRNAVYRLEAKP